MYGSTATWHGGIGGAAMTWGICDYCWGSGDVNRPWADQRKLKADEDTRVHLQAARLFTDAVQAPWVAIHPAILYVREQLLKLLKQRKERPEYVEHVVLGLTRVLKEMVDSEKGLVEDEEAEDACRS